MSTLAVGARVEGVIGALHAGAGAALATAAGTSSTFERLHAAWQSMAEELAPLVAIPGSYVHAGGSESGVRGAGAGAGAVDSDAEGRRGMVATPVAVEGPEEDESDDEDNRGNGTAGNISTSAGSSAGLQS